MPKTQSKKKIITLLEAEQRTQKEIEGFRNELVLKLCPKGKDSCEPEYCTFRMTETCPFLKKWRRILAKGLEEQSS